MANRIKTIQSLLEKDPGDVFLHYSLAMEYVSASQPAQAQEHFGVCIQLDPNYLPAYVELGKCYRTAGHFQKAREVFAAGLQLAAAQAQQHTQDYIRQQVEGLPNT